MRTVETPGELFVEIPGVVSPEGVSDGRLERLATLLRMSSTDAFDSSRACDVI